MGDDEIEKAMKMTKTYALMIKKVMNSNYEKNIDECSNSKELEELAECDPDDSSMPPSMRSERSLL